MININIDKVIVRIGLPCKIFGEKIVSSSLLNAGSIKDELRLAVQGIFIPGEIRVDKCGINLGDIPVAQFDTLFIPRLAQAFAERLACEQASVSGLQAMKMATSSTTESGMLPGGYHPDGEALIQLARCCLTPQAFKTLLQDSPAYQLQHLLKRLLEGAWQSPKMLPASWYGRVTADRLSIASILYLLKIQREYDWLMHQHAPTASQVTGWTKAIARREIPPEQVVQLLTSNQPFDSMSPGQPACPYLVMMRWLLPLWRQPAVRQVIHRLKGGRGVQRLDAYLSRCLQRQDDDVMQEEQGRDTGLHQAVLARDNTALSQSEEMPITYRGAMPLRKGGFRSQNEPHLSSQGISNAGLLLLWPLLPQLFSQLGLWEEEQFVSDAARWQAVYGLDRLVWGEANLKEERLTLNQVLCGVSLFASVPPTVPLSVLQLQQIDDWLTAIGQQLAGWQKLSLTDIRQLFLQRAGEISTEGAVPQISVRPEPYDFLLRDWPWPMTLASFPWTEQPLTIVWPLNGFTG